MQGSFKMRSHKVKPTSNHQPQKSGCITKNFAAAAGKTAVGRTAGAGTAGNARLPYSHAPLGRTATAGTAAVGGCRIAALCLNAPNCSSL